jgi:outer membrane protein OmpA-like peptidoglycan-associated protein
MTNGNVAKRTFSRQRGFLAEPGHQPIQAKLRISQPGDKYEQEADQVADQVMAMSEPVGVRNTPAAAPPQIQHLCAGCKDELQRQPLDEEEEEEEDEPVQMKSASGRLPSVTTHEGSLINGLNNGRPLSGTTRHFFEPRFGRDFSQVRIHTGSQAAAAASAINARAFTRGHDLVFGAGQYEPETKAGRWLLGHELAHVAQQANNKGTAATGLGMLEAEADRAADAALSGHSFQVRHAAQSQQRLAVPVATGPGRVEIPSPDRIILNNFDIERATMKPEWSGAIGLAAQILNLNPCKEAQIEGHTDNTGGDAFNLTLSSNRAMTIQRALRALVLEPAVASPLTLGFGEAFPKDTNATTAGRARNRRVEIEFVDRPLPAIDRVELLNSAASHTFVIPALAPVPRSDHGVTVAREVAADAHVRAVLNPPLNPGDRRAGLIRWTGAAQNPANPIEAEISRAAGQNVGVAQIACPLAAPPASSAQFTVWSVNATIASAVPTAQVRPQAASQLLTMAALNFNVLVTPVTLFSTADAPNMRGNAVPATPVPGAGTPHPVLGGDLANGVNSRWDVTRRVRTKFIYPAHLAGVPLDAGAPPVIGNPVAAYPADRLIGNDDRGTADEDNNPYVDGRMSGFDQLGFGIRNAPGNHLDTYTGRLHFQEFVRLDLGTQWRQISDDHPWKVHHILVKINALAVNRWFNFGSFGARDNAGF